MIVQGQISTYDVPSNAQDISQEFYSVSQPESNFFNNVLVGDSVTSTSLIWWEDKLLPTGSTLKSAFAADATSMTLASAQGVREGSILKLADTLYRVTSTPSSAGTFNVTVVGGTQAAGAIGAVVEFLNNANAEGDDFIDSDYSGQTKIENVTQIITDTITVTGTQKAVNSQVSALNDIVGIEGEKKIQRIYRELARSIWHNVMYDPDNNTTPRIMGGIYSYMKTHGYTMQSAFSQDAFDKFLDTIYQTRGMITDQVWLNPADVTRFDAFLKNPQTIIVPNGEGVTIGNQPIAYRSKNGYSVSLNIDTNCKAGRISLVDPATVKMRPLQGRQLQMAQQASAADKEFWAIVGEYTMEFNPCHQSGYFEITG